MFLLCGFVGFVSAGPIAEFSANVTSGVTPLPVSFTDLSSNSPTGWAWYFGDETYTALWTQQTASAGWSPRYGHSCVVMPDGSIVLMGGEDPSVTRKNDVWRSTDNGATWTQMTIAAGWSARSFSSSVAMPDGNIVLMGGYGGSNDVWRSTNNGATWTQVNASAGWSARSGHSSVAMPDGSIVLMGGGFSNDVWRSTDNGATWTQMTAGAGWKARSQHTSVAMPDGSIVLMGGYTQSSSPYDKNDVWRSTDNGATWTQMTAGAGWIARHQLSSVAMPDGSIVLMGGYDLNWNYKNDVWRSTDNGATWTQLPTAGWEARSIHSSVAMPDGSIVLMGGYDGNRKNDVWRIMPAGSSAQNPTHTYTIPGVYAVQMVSHNPTTCNPVSKTTSITVLPPLITTQPTTVITTGPTTNVTTQPTTMNTTVPTTTSTTVPTTLPTTVLTTETTAPIETIYTTPIPTIIPMTIVTTKNPTPWPTNTPTQPSPLGIETGIIATIGAALLIIKWK